MKSSRPRPGGHNKTEKIDEISDIKFRQTTSLKGKPFLSSEKTKKNIHKEKIFRQYLNCSKKNFQLWEDNEDKDFLNQSAPFKEIKGVTYFQEANYDYFPRSQKLSMRSNPMMKIDEYRLSSIANKVSQADSRDRKSEDLSYQLLSRIIKEELLKAEARKASFQKITFRPAKSILFDHRMKCLLKSSRLKTRDDQVLYESWKLESRRELIHSLFFLGMPTGRSSQSQSRSTSQTEKDAFSRGTKKLFKTQSSSFFNFGNLRQAQMALKLLKFSSVDDELWWRHYKARDWRRHVDFLSCHELPFRKLKQYFMEMEDPAHEDEEGGRDKKSKDKNTRERKVFQEISLWHQNFDEFVEEYKGNFKISVVDLELKLNGGSGGPAKTDKNPKNTKNSKNKNETKKGEEADASPYSLMLNNISWNYQRKTPSEEISPVKGVIGEPSYIKTKAPHPAFSAFIKSDFWTRLHCLYEFDPMLKPLKEMDIISSHSLSNIQSSQFKMTGNLNQNISQEDNHQQMSNPVNPWGATFSGLADFHHAPNEFVFWLSSCLQGIIDNQMDSVDDHKHSFLQNIYPQMHGRPVTSLNGEYWVKLNYMGKQVKVKVDDYLPVDCVSGELMLPLTERGEIWPALYIKAVCKLYGIGEFYQTSDTLESIKKENAKQINLILQQKKRLSSQWTKEGQTDSESKISFHSSILYGNNMMSFGQSENKSRRKSKHEKESHSKSRFVENKERLSKLEQDNRFPITRIQNLQFEDLIANIDVIYTITGFIPLVLNSKNWDTVFFTKFCEAISEEKIYENKIKIFGVKQNKRNYRSFSKYMKKTANSSFAKNKLEKRGKSSRTNSYSQERMGSVSNMYFPLPFGPVRYLNKLDLIKKILKNNDEYDEAFMWKALGFLDDDLKTEQSKSSTKSDETDTISSLHLRSRQAELMKMSIEERKEVYKFMRKIYGEIDQTKFSILDVVYKDLLAGDISGKDGFHHYLDQHWSSILGKISIEHSVIQAGGREQLETNLKINLGTDLSQKINCLIKRSLRHGSLFKNISLNHCSPFLIFSRSPKAILESLTSSSTYQKEFNFSENNSSPLLTIPSFICNKKDIPKFISMRNSYNIMNKKSLKQLNFSFNTASSRKSSLIKAPNIDNKTKRDFIREDQCVWGQPDLRENFYYAITDIFENGKFNMEYVRKINTKEINLRKKYLTLLKNKPEYVSKEDIKRIKNLRKDLRLKIKDMEKQRYDLLQKKMQYKLVGYKSHLGGGASPEYGLYNAQEILIARICMLNNLSKPPNFKDFTELSKKEKLKERHENDNKLVNLKQSMKRINNSILQNSQEMSLKMIHKYEKILLHHIRSSLLDFSSVKKLAYPSSIRADQYLDLDVLPLIFQKFCFYFNPLSFEKTLHSQGDNSVRPWIKKDIKIGNQIFFVNFESTEAEKVEEDKQEVAEDSTTKNNVDSQTNHKSQPSNSFRTIKKKTRPKTEILFHFQHSDWPQLPHQKTTLILSKMDIIKNRILKTEEKLEFSNNSHLIKRAEDQVVYKLSGFIPNSYCLSLFSQNNIYQMSISEYLKQIKKWNQQTFNVKTNKIIPGIPEIVSRFEIKFESSADCENGLLFIDFELEFNIEKEKEDTQMMLKEKNEKEKAMRVEAKKKKKSINELEKKHNRLYQVFDKKQKKPDKLEVETKKKSIFINRHSMKKNILGVSTDSEDDFEDDRLEIGKKLNIPSPEESKCSFLSRFFYFELVSLDDIQVKSSFSENSVRQVSSQGLFEDSSVIKKGKLNQTQRVAFSPGKFILTVYTLTPQEFPVHDVALTITSPKEVEVVHLSNQEVTDFIGHYSPNKYFSLFNDKLLFNDEWTTLSFHLQLFEKRDENLDKPALKDKEKETLKTDNKKRKRGDKEIREPKKEEFSLDCLQDLSEDLHVILELHFRDKLLHRFGGRKSVMSAPFRLHKRGPEKSESMSKTNFDNKIDFPMNLIQGNSSRNIKLDEDESDPMKEIEGGFKFPTRMLSKTPKKAKKIPSIDERKTNPNSTVKTNHSWSVGEWTIKAYLDPRENQDTYSDQKKNSTSNSYKAFILDPDAIKYYDLSERNGFEDEIKRQMENKENLDQNPTKKVKELVWHLRIVSNCEVRTTRDTRKEESQNKFIVNWELSEPGRKKIASVLREIFLLTQKQRVTALTSKEENKLKKLKAIEDAQLAKVISKHKKKEEQASIELSQKELIELKKGKNGKQKQKLKEKTVKMASKIIANESTPDANEDLKEKSFDLKIALNSTDSFSKPIRNLCRSWEGPKNLFINSHKPKQIREEGYDEFMKQQSQLNKQKMEDFKRQMEDSHNRIFRQRKALYEQRKDFMLQNQSKLIQIFQKTKSQMVLKLNETKQNNFSEQKSMTNHVSNVSIHKNLTGEEQSQLEIYTMNEFLMPSLSHLKKIHEVHQQEIQLITKIFKEMDKSRQKEMIWQKMTTFFHEKVANAENKKTASKGTNGLKKKTKDIGGKKGKLNTSNNNTSIKTSLSSNKISVDQVNNSKEEEYIELGLEITADLNTSHLPMGIQSAIQKLSIEEMIESIEEFMSENDLTMNELQIQIFKFLKRQRSIKRYLKQFEELSKEKNKAEMREVIKAAEAEGFNLEVEISEDEESELSDDESYEDNLDN